jgi:hypothetical protein
MTIGMIERRGTAPLIWRSFQLERPHDVSPARSFPLGATSVEGGVNFSIFSSQWRTAARGRS